MSTRGESVSRVDRLTRPAWRVTLSARAPRIVAGVLAGVLMVAGLRAIVAGPPEPPPAPELPVLADQGAEAFVEGFTRAYLSWDPDRLERRDRELAAYVSSELDAGAGLEPSDRVQSVDWTAVVGSVPSGRRERVVTVVASVEGRRWHLAVPVTRVARGYLVVATYPALVGPPPAATDEPLAQEDDVAEGPLADVAERAVRNYLARERANLAADLASEAVVSLPDAPVDVEAIEGITHAGPNQVAVALTARLAGARMTLRYELSMVRRDERWSVAGIETDPRHLAPGAGQ